MQDASKLVRSLKADDRWVDLYVTMGLQNVQDIRDLTALETGSRKQRAQVLIDFTCCLSDTFDANYFNQLPMDLQDSDGVIHSDLPGGTNPHECSP